MSVRKISEPAGKNMSNSSPFDRSVSAEGEARLAVDVLRVSCIWTIITLVYGDLNLCSFRMGLPKTIKNMMVKKLQWNHRTSNSSNHVKHSSYENKTMMSKDLWIYINTTNPNLFNFNKYNYKPALNFSLILVYFIYQIAWFHFFFYFYQFEPDSPRSWRWNGSGTVWGVWSDCRVSCSSACTRDSGDRL